MKDESSQVLRINYSEGDEGEEEKSVLAAVLMNKGRMQSLNMNGGSHDRKGW